VVVKTIRYGRYRKSKSWDLSEKCGWRFKGKIVLRIECGRQIGISGKERGVAVDQTFASKYPSFLT
jgi:hypothetical protein